jgi:hypothetical protein
MVSTLLIESDSFGDFLDSGLLEDVTVEKGLVQSHEVAFRRDGA